MLTPDEEKDTLQKVDDLIAEWDRIISALQTHRNELYEFRSEDFSQWHPIWVTDYLTRAKQDVSKITGIPIPLEESDLMPGPHDRVESKKRKNTDDIITDFPPGTLGYELLRRNEGYLP